MNKLLLIGSQWVLFAFILATVAMWYLLKENKALRIKLDRCEQEWAIVEPQIQSKRIIMELK